METLELNIYDMENYYIYALIDPTDNIIKYIGKTNNIEKRLKKHISKYSINSEPCD